MIDFMVQGDATAKQIIDTLKQQKLMPVLGKDQLEIANLEAELTEKGKVLVNNGISIIEGTCRANNYRDVAKILVAMQKEIPGLIPAMGTQSNILSIHYAVEAGVPMIIAADGMPPLGGQYAVPKTQAHEIGDFKEYVKSHIGDFCGRLKLNGSQTEFLKNNPLTMDPIAYCIARNVIFFPAWYTRGELGGLLARGARTLKGFNFGERKPKQWDELTTAVSSDYAAEIIGMMGTGGLSIKLIKDGNLTAKEEAMIASGNAVKWEHGGNLYLDSVTPCLSAKYFIAAGASDIGKGTAEQVEKVALLYVKRVEEYKKTIKDKK